MPEDGETIVKFNSLLAEETEGRRLNPAVIGSGVRRLLEDASRGRYWMAEADGTIVGQIMVTYEWSDWRNGALWWIQSVYVHPDHRRAGAFTALYRHVESSARQSDARGLRLYVKRSNKRAQQTYAALGMLNPNYQVMEAIFGETKC